VIVPRNRATIAGTHCGASGPRTTTPIVFVVDDDVSVRASLELLVPSSGWEVETFASARDFFARSPALVPNCLILDVGLPDVNRLELHKHVAINRPETRIIVTTGYADVPMSVQARNAGAFDFLTKPFRDKTLLAEIRDALERSRRATAT
jgi:FixJ family two-component response regulator